MTAPFSSGHVIVEMRALAKELFSAGINALSATGSSTVYFHPRMAQLACLNAVRSAAFDYCQTVLATHSAMASDASVSASELLRLAEGADGIDGSVAIVLGRNKRGPCNKRLALSFALAAERSRLRRPWIFLSGTTGRRDCRYHSAGAIVDAGTCSWIWPEEHPVGSPADPTSLLAASGDLLLTDLPASYAMNIDLIILA